MKFVHWALMSLCLTSMTAIVVPESAVAKGCIKGAVVGAVAGHMVGHGKLGAAAGCAVGHHEANKSDAQNPQGKNQPTH
jgi:uncharacterized protein YcfJ